ncbi:hypothetical protein AK812_SmicGene48820, partial [Symbiodinium microadriaticum]
ASEFVAVYKEPALLPEIYRAHFGMAEAGELPASAVVLHGPLRGSHKSLGSSGSRSMIGNNMVNPGFFKKMMAAGNMSMMGLMKCMQQRNQQQPSSSSLPGFKLLGKAGNVQPEQQEQLQLAVPAAGQDPVGPAEQARQMLAAWSDNAAKMDAESDGDVEPKKKPAAKLPQTKSVKPMKKPAAQAKSESQPKLNVKNLTM